MSKAELINEFLSPAPAFSPMPFWFWNDDLSEEEIGKQIGEFREKGGAVVGLLDDVWVSNTKYLDEALAIIQDTGVTYTNLCAWDGYDEVLEAVGTPTTYFVDSNGKLIGEPILGAHTDKYRERMEKYLESAK